MLTSKNDLCDDNLLTAYVQRHYSALDVYRELVFSREIQVRMDEFQYVGASSEWEIFNRFFI